MTTGYSLSCCSLFFVDMCNNAFIWKTGEHEHLNKEKRFSALVNAECLRHRWAWRFSYTINPCHQSLWKWSNATPTIIFLTSSDVCSEHSDILLLLKAFEDNGLHSNRNLIKIWIRYFGKVKSPLLKGKSNSSFGKIIYSTKVGTMRSKCIDYRT